MSTAGAIGSRDEAGFLLDLFLLTSWLPTEMQTLGVTAGLALIIGALLQLGGVFGLVFGWLADKAGASVAIGAAYLTGAVCVAVICAGVFSSVRKVSSKI